MKYAWIDQHSDSQAIARLGRLVGVSRTGFLQWRSREPSKRDIENRVLDAHVAIIHAEQSNGMVGFAALGNCVTKGSKWAMSEFDSVFYGKICVQSTAAGIE